MIDSVLNLLFRCPHRHMTRPMTPVSKAGEPQGETYVVCLDCAKQFAYDLRTMTVGRPIAPSPQGGVLQRSKPRSHRLHYALGVGVPLALLAGSVWKTKPKDSESATPNGAGRDRNNNTH
jgi:hypothetical protein